MSLVYILHTTNLIEKKAGIKAELVVPVNSQDLGRWSGRRTLMRLVVP